MAKIHINLGEQQFSDKPTSTFETAGDWLEQCIGGDILAEKRDFILGSGMDTIVELAKSPVGKKAIQEMSKTPLYAISRQIPSYNNGMYNRGDTFILMYLSSNKMEHFQKEAWEKGEYETFVWLNPEKRAQSLQKVVAESDYKGKKLEKLVCKTWCLSEHDLESRKIYKDIFKKLAGGEYFENTKKKLREELTVYRGGTPDGISWTLSKKKALYFQNRYEEYGFDKTPLLQKQVSKTDIVCFINDMREREVIILPDNEVK